MQVERGVLVVQTRPAQSSQLWWQPHEAVVDKDADANLVGSATPPPQSAVLFDSVLQGDLSLVLESDGSLLCTYTRSTRRSDESDKVLAICLGPGVVHRLRGE